MPPIVYILLAIFVGLAVVWPLAFFGYKFYADAVHAEEAKNAGHH